MAPRVHFTHHLCLVADPDAGPRSWHDIHRAGPGPVTSACSRRGRLTTKRAEVTCRDCERDLRADWRPRADRDAGFILECWANCCRHAGVACPLGAAGAIRLDRARRAELVDLLTPFEASMSDFHREVMRKVLAGLDAADRTLLAPVLQEIDDALELHDEVVVRLRRARVMASAIATRIRSSGLVAVPLEGAA